MIQGILATLLIVWAAFFLIKEARKKSVLGTRDAEIVGVSGSFFIEGSPNY